MDNLVSSFKVWLENDEKLSTSTVDVYLASIRHFLRYYEKSFDKNFQFLDEVQVKSYWIYLNFNNFSVPTVKARIAGLKKFNQFLMAKEYQDNFVVKIEYPNLDEPKEEVPLTTSDILNFISTIKTDGSKRDLAIVMLKLKTDINITEIIKLELTDYLDNRRFLIHVNATDVRYIYVDKELQEIISDYLNERKSSPLSTSKYLFISNKSEQLRKRQIFNLFKKYSEMTNLLTPVTPKRLEKFIDIDLKERLIILRDFSFVIENGEEKINVDIEFITNDFAKDSFVKFALHVKYKDINRKFFYIIAKTEIIDKFVEKEGIFLAKGWLFTNNLNHLIIKNFFYKSVCLKEHSVPSFISKLESSSMEIDYFRYVK